MVGDTSVTRLAGIRPASLCREDRRKVNIMATSASSLPSLARLGMFKAINDSKSRFIRNHMKSAAELGLESEAEGGGLPLPRQCRGPAVSPRTKAPARLAVMTTEQGLEEYRRGKKADARYHVQHPQVRGRSRTSKAAARRAAAGAHVARLRAIPFDLRSRHDKGQYISTHVVKLPQGGSVLVGVDGVSKSRFPWGCEPTDRMELRAEQGGAGERTEPGACALDRRGQDVVARLCNPSTFTGTAATGHLPTTVDLEGGVGVLLKDASLGVKDHVGTQEMSWRLRLAERL